MLCQIHAGNPARKSKRPMRSARGDWKFEGSEFFLFCFQVSFWVLLFSVVCFWVFCRVFCEVFCFVHLPWLPFMLILSRSLITYFPTVSGAGTGGTWGRRKQSLFCFLPLLIFATYQSVRSSPRSPSDTSADPKLCLSRLRRQTPLHTQGVVNLSCHQLQALCFFSFSNQ